MLLAYYNNAFVKTLVAATGESVAVFTSAVSVSVVGTSQANSASNNIGGIAVPAASMKITVSNEIPVEIV